LVRGSDSLVVVLEEGDFDFVAPEIRDMSVSQYDAASIGYAQEQWQLFTPRWTDGKDDRAQDRGDCLMISVSPGGLK